jgi:hypothetical protein
VGAAVLDGVARATRRPPALPKTRAWHALTRAWWRDVWRSPMASEYLDVDRHGLLRLAELIEQFWRGPSVQLAAEIRQQEARFGLSPIDRRRLQWEVRRAEADAATGPSGASGAIAAAGDDPRTLLAAV